MVYFALIYHALDLPVVGISLKAPLSSHSIRMATGCFLDQFLGFDVYKQNECDYQNFI